MATKPQQKKAGTAVAERRGAMVLVQDQAPEYINTKGNRGSENVGTADLVIPRLEVVQALSPAVKKSDPGYIKGAEAGMLTNSVTRALYGEKVTVVPIHFSVQYLVWRDRKKGTGEGGFFGAYPTLAEANDRMEAEGGSKAGIEVIDTPTHLCLLIHPETWEVEEILISMPRTKAKISRQWNTMIRMNGGDRFSRVYTLGTQEQKNAKGDFFNFAIDPTSGFPAEALYKRAESLYQKIAAGEKRVVMDVSHMGGEGDDPDDGDAKM